MGDYLDNVFVSLDGNLKYGMRVLEWALDYFDNDKTKIVLTNYYGIVLFEEFMKTAEEIYLQRCAEKKFRAEILVPQASNSKDSILELAIKHDMKKLVYLKYGWIIHGLTTWFDENPTISCKIWVVNHENGELIIARDTCLYPGKSATNEQLNELLQKENDLHRQMVEQRPLREERNNLKEEVDRLRKREIAAVWQITQPKEKHISSSSSRNSHFFKLSTFYPAKKTGQAEELRQLNERISALTVEKECNIKELQEANKQMLNLESTKTNEIHLLRNEKELLSKELEVNKKLLEAETIRRQNAEGKMLLMNKHEEELRLTIEKHMQRINDLMTEKLELESAKANQDEQHKKDKEMFLIKEKQEKEFVQLKNGQMVNELNEQHMKDIDELLKKEKEKKDVFHLTIQELNQRISILTMEKGDNIKELQEANVQILHLESTKANEICHLKDEKELLSKNLEENAKFLEAEIIRSRDIEERFLLLTTQVEELRLTNEKGKQRISDLVTEKLHDSNQHKVELELIKASEINLLRKVNDLLSKSQEDSTKLLLMTEQAEQWRRTIEQMTKDQASLATMKDKVASLESDNVKLQADQEKAVKETAKLRNQTKHSGLITTDFTFQELEEATQNFSDLLKIGQGGFGCVYKGNLHGRDVAIKTLNSKDTQPILAFKREVDILSTIRHPNLVTLIGACHEASILVYEFVPNKSLETYLTHENNTSPLVWHVRTRIIGEICLALMFLHSNRPNVIIHGDLKPDNLLLDTNFGIKLGDFGISHLAKQSDTNTTVLYKTYNPIGTPGYIDPEFVTSCELSELSDVYAFGIIILRLLTGRKSPIRITREVEDAMANKTFHKMIDASAGQWPIDQAQELAHLGLRCACIDRKGRPNLFNEVWPIVEKLRRNAK